MAIIKKPVVVSKTDAKPIAKPTAKPVAKTVAKTAMKPYDNSKYLADSAAKAPMVRKRNQEWTRDSTKMENSVKTIDSINKANKGSLLMSIEDANKYKTAEDSFYSASGRVIKKMRGDISEMKKGFTYTPDKKSKKK
jgi:hypothetical protein